MGPSTPIHLLLVDDSRDYLDLLTTSLERTDLEVDITTTTDPEKALTLLDSTPVDCVVSDYEMPSRTGLELLGAVRERDPSLPFILLTGAGSEAVASDAIDAEVTMYLRKHAADSAAEMADRLADVIDDAVRAYHREAALEDHLTFIDSVLGALDDIIYVVAPDGTPLYWSEAFREVTGYGDVDLSRLTAYDIVPDEYHDALSDAMSTVLAGESVTVQIPISPREGEPIPFELSGAPLYGDDGSVVGIAGIGRDLTERQRYETALEGVQRTTRRLLDADDHADVIDAVTDAAEYIVPASHSVVYRHDAERGVLAPAEPIAGVESEGTFRYDEDEDAPVARVYRTGEPERSDVQDIDDDRYRYDIDGVFYFPLGDHGVLALGLTESNGSAGRTWALGEILATNATAALDRIDRTAALRDRERVLATLHERSADLADSTTPAEVSETIVDAASAVIDAPNFAVYHWDDATGRLRPAAVAGHVDAPPVDASSGGRLVWEAFVENRTVVDGDIGDDPERVPWSDARSAMAHPLGDHGVFVAASRTADAFDDRDVEFADLLATNARSALERATRETRLRETEAELGQRNADLQRINRLNGVIRDIMGALVQAESREGITHAVCENLVTDDRYALAWVGTQNGAVTVESWAGTGVSFLDHIQDKADAHPLAGESHADGDPIVVDDVLRDPRFDALRREAMDREFRSAIRLPLRYNDREHGVLEIYARTPDAFSGEELDVLTELAAHIGNALDAAERTKTLLSGRSLELQFSLDSVDDPLFALAERADRSLDIEAVTPRDDGWLVYASVEGDPDAVLDAAERSVAVTAPNVVRSTDDSTLLVLVVSHSTVVQVFVDQGATIRHLRATPAGGTVTVGVRPSTDVRSFSDAVCERLPSASLSRRTVSADEAGSALKHDLEEVLTERQLQALQAAYVNGYFDWPRENTGETVASDLGISGPTFHQHLRKALDRLLGDAFESDAA